jgi:hypothetical protein
VREPWDHLGGSINGVIDVSQGPREGVVSSFEFAPVFVVGLRWRLFEGLLGATPTGATPGTGSLRSSPMPLLQADRTPLGLLR